MKKIKFPMLQLIGYQISNWFKLNTQPKQLEELVDDPSSLPEYQHQVKFLKENNINESYECFQCMSFDSELDGCNTPYEHLYCGKEDRINRMCPGFNPPKEGKFVFDESELENFLKKN